MLLNADVVVWQLLWRFVQLVQLLVGGVRRGVEL
jgi:hypothetical protein